MYQSIALSSEALSSFKDNFDKWFDAVKYLSKEKEIFVTDVFTKELNDLINTMEDKQISSLMAATVFPILNKITARECSSNINYRGIKNKDDLKHLKLTEKSENKILVTNRKNLELVLKINNPKSQISICSGLNYVDPSINDNVANPRKILNIQDKDPIDPHIVLFPYIRLSNSIKILDPYPPIFPKTKDRKLRALPIWRDFIKSCKRGSKIIFTTVSDSQRNKKIGSKYYSLTEKDISKALNADIRHDMELKIIFSSEKIMGRSIETDQFFIQIEHGLGMFRWNRDEYINNAGLNAHIIVTHFENKDITQPIIQDIK
jgi:hypothetical protein